jgi:hypothetical protein
LTWYCWPPSRRYTIHDARFEDPRGSPQTVAIGGGGLIIRAANVSSGEMDCESIVDLRDDGIIAALNLTGCLQCRKELGSPYKRLTGR